MDLASGPISSIELASRVLEASSASKGSVASLNLWASTSRRCRLYGSLPMTTSLWPAARQVIPLEIYFFELSVYEAARYEESEEGKILGADSLGLLCSYALPNCTVPFGLVLGMTRLFACLLLEHSNLQYTRFKNKLSPPVRNPLSLGRFISLSHSDKKY
jgi:hypothetical protein